MKATRTLALVFLLGLITEPLGLAILVRSGSSLAGFLTTSKAPECMTREPTISDATWSLLGARLTDSTQENSGFEARAWKQDGDWSVLVYLDGDNDLEAAAFEDLNSMELVGSTPGVGTLVYADFMSATSGHGAWAECYYVVKDTNMSEINSLALATSLPIEPNMGDPDTLLQFITFGQNFMPAEHYLLVLWDHGGGFYGVCMDETSGNDRLLPDEISAVLSDATIQPIDMVAFDACLMGQLEIAYELRDDAQLVLFSEESIPESGFPYEKFLGDLVNNTSWSPGQLASSMVVRYNEAYATGGLYYDPANPDTYICLSAINGSRTTNVAGALNNLVQPLLTLTTLRSYYEFICAARGATQSFSWPDFMDLGDFAKQLRAVLPSSALSNLSLILQNSVTAAVLREEHLSGLPGATGLGLAFSTHRGISLELLTDTSYEDFMRAFEGLGNTSATALSLTNSGTYHGYLDGKGDDVYFRFIPDTSAVYMFRLDSMQVYDEDFDLYLCDSSLNEVDASEGYTSTEIIEYNCVAGEVYYLRVHSYADPDIVDGLGAFSLAIFPAFWIDPALVGLLIVAIVIIVLVVICAVVATRRSRLRRWEQSSAYTSQPAASPAAHSAAPPSAENPGFCTNCGAPLLAGAQHCPACGQRLYQ